MAKKGRKRKIMLALGIALAALVLMLAGLPLWLPWVSRPILGRYNVHYATYKRAGYSRFELTDVVYASKNIRVTSAHVEALLPTAWLWQRTIHSREPAVCLRAQNWKVEIVPGKAT